MNGSGNEKWHSANQKYLNAALAVLRVTLQSRLGGARLNDHHGTVSNDMAEQEALQQARAAMPGPPALEILCGKFRLSNFEKDLLLLCAGVELDASLAALCATMHGDPQRSYPTFSLALAIFPEAYWSAIAPVAPLRRWRLLEIAAGHSIAQGVLRIDERVLHYIAGVPHLEDRLAALLETAGREEALVPSHDKLAEAIAMTWSGLKSINDLPIIQLCGGESNSKRAIATAACARLGLHLKILSAQLLPLSASESESLMRLWEREAALMNSALLLDCEEVDQNDHARKSAVTRFLDGTMTALLVASRERRGNIHRQIVTLDVPRPTAGEQKMLWQKTLGQAAPLLRTHVEALVSQFSLGAPTIQNAFAEARTRATEQGITNWERNEKFPELIWEACRVHARPRLDELAQRIIPTSGWDELVLPEAQIQILRDTAAHVRQRAKVYESWGFAGKGNRGLGISALFAGASGTGKTMAAEVLAHTLHLDLYRIDLSQVVNKYIGETEKNLRRVFDAAEEGGAILLFDEADALFGKRSEIKDSHDRYANIEISYLLQRMEAYRGLAILTTNMKQALDTAFMRRIRFVVQFPFPDTAQRGLIWRRIFPANTPTEGLDFDKLAQLNVTGGNIRNIALNAAFLAAEAGEAVSMKHILRAAKSEYVKMEKSLTEVEVKGWV